MLFFAALFFLVLVICIEPVYGIIIAVIFPFALVACMDWDSKKEERFWDDVFKK